MIVLDIEIAKPIKAQEDWAKARNGLHGISIAVVYDDADGRLYFYDEHTIDALVDHITASPRVVTFNGHSFDIPCIEGVAGQTITMESHCDILQKIWDALGGRYKGYSLNAVAERTLGIGKSGSGLRAPELYNSGRIAELVQYCSDDVLLTLHLHEYILEHGHIIDVDGNKLSVDLR